MGGLLSFKIFVLLSSSWPWPWPPWYLTWLTQEMLWKSHSTGVFDPKKDPWALQINPPDYPGVTSNPGVIDKWSFIHSLFFNIFYRVSQKKIGFRKHLDIATHGFKMFILHFKKEKLGPNPSRPLKGHPWRHTISLEPVWTPQVLLGVRSTYNCQIS